MKKNSFLFIILISLVLVGFLYIMGCESFAYAAYGASSQFTNTSCALENDCNGNTYYCGRSSCSASQVDSSTRCACY